MDKIIEEIGKIGIVPVIALDDANDAKPLAKALMDGGIPCAEVTFRTAAAKEAIRIISQEYPDMLVGAGTVLTKEQVDEAIDAGSKFIVSPGLNPQVVSYCLEKHVTVIPGTANPSDVEAALSLGLDVVKFFPAEAAGGIAMIKAMSAPYGNVKFMPTGGINAENLGSYLDFEKIVACGGSWMVKKELVKSGEFEKIRQLTEEAVTKMLGFRVCQVGVNSPDDAAAQQMAGLLAKAFGFGKKEEQDAVVMGDSVRIMLQNKKGPQGSIVVQTNYLDRAVYHLKRRGIAFDEAHAVYDEAHRMISIDLKEQPCGFAIGLVQR